MYGTGVYVNAARLHAHQFAVQESAVIILPILNEQAFFVDPIADATLGQASFEQAALGGRTNQAKIGKITTSQQHFAQLLIQRMAVRHHQHITASRQMRRLIDQFGLMLTRDALHISGPASQVSQAIEGLRAIVGREAVITNPEELTVYECDAYTLEKHLPAVVVLPNNAEEVVAVVKLCAQHNLPIIPRGAGTGLSGSVTPRKRPT